MRLLRVEEPAAATGATLGARQLWQLAQAWYGNRLDANWRPRTREAAQQVLASLGLVDPFWQLP
jgi:hypothetical protein